MSTATLEQQDDAGSARELLRVALPLIISSGSQSLLHVVDRIFLTWWSVDAVAASLPAGVFYWTLLSLPFGTVMYANTFVAQYTGAGRSDRVAASIWQAVYFALLCGCGLAALAPVSGVLIGWTGHTGTIARLETDYLAITFLGALPALVGTACSTFFSGRGRTVVIMWVHVFASLLNIALDPMFIFGFGPIPEMGIRGAAWATNIANVVSCLLFVGLLVIAARKEGYSLWRARRFDRELTGRMLRFGLPTGVQHFVDVGAFLLFVILAGRLGSTAAAATALAFNLNTMVFIPMIGFGTAVLTLVGRRIGEQRADLAARTTWIAFALAAAYMGAFAVLYVLTPHWLLAPYAATEHVAEFQAIEPVVVVLLRFVAVYSFFDAMAIIFGSAIRGAGDSQFSFWWTFATSWLLMVLPTWLAVRAGYGGLPICWTAAAIYITVLGIGFLIRFLGGRWREMSVIEQTESALDDDAVLAPATATGGT